MTTELLSFSAYARRRGVSQPYISQMVKRGKIPLTNGKINPELADAALAAHADADMAPVAASHAARRQSPPGAPYGPPAKPAAEPDPPMGTGRYVETRMSAAKTKDAEYSAKQRQVDYEKSVGLLVEASEVTRALADVGSALTQLDTMPDRLLARLRAAPDEHSARLLWVEEIATFRQSVADFYLALAERMTVNPS